MTERVVDDFKLSTQCGLSDDRWIPAICIRKENGGGPSLLVAMGLFFERESAEAHAEKRLAEVIGVTANWVLLFPGDMR